MAIPTRLHPLFPTSAAPDSRAAPSSPASGAAPSAFVVADGGGCTYRGLPKVRVVEGCGSTVLPRPLLAALGQCVLSFGEDWEAELAARAAGRRSTGRRQPMSDQADPSKLEGIPGHCYGNLRRVRITGFCSRKMLVKLTCHILENTPSLECLTLDIAPDTIGQVRSTDDPIKVFSEVPLGKCGYPNLHRGKSSLHF
ncbi:hypothetical protein ACQ4PT_029015 [Festuca glaucescens]